METFPAGDTVQTNVRVAEIDKPLVLQVAQRLRSDADFRDKLAALLEDHACAGMEERIKKLEQQVSWLLSGAIVVPRAPMRPAQPAPNGTSASSAPGPKLPPAKLPPILGPRRAADHPE
jgi:hypothetical protein